MRKLIIYSFILLSATFSSCNFLDVNERDDMKHEILFTSEDGFQQALIGVYIKCASTSLYGRMTSYYLPEILARTYAVSADAAKTSQLYIFSEYAFEENRSTVDGVMQGLWNSYFRAIAQLNDILLAMDENEKVKFLDKNDRLLLAEAYGLRAFLHLDVLRFWGKVPSTYQDSDKAVPYVTEFTRDNNKLKSKTFAEFKQLIENDLNRAEAILKDVDPFMLYSRDQLNPRIPADRPVALTNNWQMFRQTRMNYWAVLATKARYYQWIGDREKATEYAYRVVSSDKFALTQESDYTGLRPNLIFFTENILAFENPNLVTGGVQSAFTVDRPSLSQTKAALDIVYETSANDIRYKYNATTASARYFAGSDPWIRFYKFGGQDSRFPDQNKMPVLRLSEMYLILMENLDLNAGTQLTYVSDLSANDVVTPMTLTAMEYWRTYRSSRGLSDALDTSFEMDKMARINLEYRKEFYGEGQIWFFFKRQNITSFSWPIEWPTETTTTSIVYELPRPDKVSLFDN